jgi:hypothetical protein
MDEPLGLRRHRNKAHLLALAINPKMHDAFSPLIITHSELAELLAPDAVKEECGEDRAVPHTFQRPRRRGLQERPSLLIAERRGVPSLLLALGRFTPFDGTLLTI